MYKKRIDYFFVLFFTSLASMPLDVTGSIIISEKDSLKEHVGKKFCFITKRTMLRFQLLIKTNSGVKFGTLVRI